MNHVIFYIMGIARRVCVWGGGAYLAAGKRWHQSALWIEAKQQPDIYVDVTLTYQLPKHCCRPSKILDGNGSPTRSHSD